MYLTCSRCGYFGWVPVKNGDPIPEMNGCKHCSETKEIILYHYEYQEFLTTKALPLKFKLRGRMIEDKRFRNLKIGDRVLIRLVGSDGDREGYYQVKFFSGGLVIFEKAGRNKDAL